MSPSDALLNASVRAHLHLTDLAGLVAEPTPKPSGGIGGEVPKPSAPSWINTAAIVGFLVFVASLLLIVLGLRLTAKSGKGNVKDAASQSAVAGIGVFWIVVGITGAAVTIVATSVGFAINN